MKKIHFLISTAVASAVILAALSINANTGSRKAPPLEIIGKTGTITFPEFKVEETFVSDSSLHWKIVDDKGAVTQGEEKISYKKLTDNQFFINWIEKNGLTVSQVIDAKNGTIVAYVSRTDEASERGKRAATFLQGTFKIKN